MIDYSDEKLLVSYKEEKGNLRRKAFDCLYRRHINELRSYFFYALGRDNAKAWDFAHDLFIKLLESPEKFNEQQKFKPWIYRVASNMCKNEYRKLVVVNKHEEHVKHTTDLISKPLASDHKLKQCIKNLTPEHRSLIVLRFKLNMTIKEMAEIYECPEGTVKSRLFYATKELSKQYKG